MPEELPPTEGSVKKKITIHTGSDEMPPQTEASWRGIFGGAVFLCVLAAGIVLSVSLQHSAYEAKGQKLQAPEPSVLGAVTEFSEERVLGSDLGPYRQELFDTGNVAAESFLVFDAQTGRAALKKNTESKSLIASMTKLMTALVSYDYANFSDVITVSAADRLEVSPALKVRTGDEVKVEDMFNAMIVGSANDAALTLANYISAKTGRNFSDLMNEKAAELGMTHSHFSNPYGFDSPTNYSTAEDLQKLIVKTQALLAFTSLGKKTSYQFQSLSGITYRVQATNKLIGSYADMEAIKTGSTSGAKEAMAVKVTLGRKKYIILVLGSPNREADVLRLRSELIKAFGGIEN